MLLEDEYGDEVEVEFHDDGTAEFSVLSGEFVAAAPGQLATGKYLGGFVIRPEEGKRLFRRLEKWLKETRGEEFDGSELNDGPEEVRT